MGAVVMVCPSARLFCIEGELIWEARAFLGLMCNACLMLVDYLVKRLVDVTVILRSTAYAVDLAKL